MRTAASIEPLETRVAPASVFTYTDVDGDIVKVISSLGDLNTPGVATKIIAGGVGGEQLTLLDLRDASFQGTNISTTVTKVAGGDGLVHIGRIDATGRDIGTVTIKGDLAVLDAGDPATAASACKALTVESMGRFGLSTQGGGDLVSNFDGKLDKLTVKFSVKETVINVTDSAGTNGKIGNVKIGGSLIGGLEDGSGEIFARDGIGQVSIKGDILGGFGASTGVVESLKDLASVTVGGALVGGAGASSGAIRSGTDMGPVKIARNVEAGGGNDSGKIDAQGKLASLTVGGSVIGSAARQSADFGSAGQIHASGRIGSITIRGSLIGGQDPTPGDMVFEASFSGGIGAFDDLGSLKIGGSVIGGLARDSCRIFVSGNLGSVTIGGSFLGDDASDSAHISAQTIGAVKIGGDIVGAPNQFESGQIGANKFASLTVGGSMRGKINANELGPVKIGGDLDGRAGSGVGFIDATNKIASVTVGGSLIGASASSGSVNFTGAIRSFTGDIGPIRIGGDMLGGSTTGAALLNQSGSIHAGGRIASVFVGGSIISGSDASTSVMIDCASIRADDDIGTIVVKGSLVGNIGNGMADNDSFVIISARGQATLASNAKTDIAIKSLSVGGDVRLAKVLAGFASFHDDDEGSNGNASIGPVTIGGDLFASSIVAGVRDAQGDGFGDNDDILIPTPAADAIVARIASVVIKGAVIGAPNPFFQCGFEAQQIGSFKVGAFTVPLTAATDAPIVLTPLTANETIREVP